MTSLPLFQNPTKIASHYECDQHLIVYNGQTLDFLATIPDSSVSLVITSPPYNLGKDYEEKEAITDYLETQGKVIKELYRVIKGDGSICWQVGNYIKDGEVFPLDILFYETFKKIGFYLRNRIIWHFGHGLHASKRFSGRYETLLWFSKSKDYIFNLDSVRVPSKYPGKRHFKGENIGKPSGNPLGKNPADVWEFLAQEWDELLWDIPNVKSNHPEKTQHPCQYPIELVERCILAFTNEGDWVLDPYAGVGSSLIASVMHNRRAAGSEKEEEYIKITHDRLNNYFNGTLKIRPLGKPIHQPTGHEKVSQRPEEWKASSQLKLMEKKQGYK